MKIKIILPIILALLMINMLQGQKSGKKITITGYVVDTHQYPVSDAIILINDVKTDCVTDENGYYEIRVRSTAFKIGVLTFSSGLTEEIINGRTRINFTLPDPVSPVTTRKEESSDDEDVDIGYGTVKKKDLTTPVNKINGTDRKYASYSSIYDMLAGEVPGVQVNGKSIQIRGITSFTLSTEPLFVVDGMQVMSIDDISPQIVQSIEILKGSSAAIYGSRGANGVILINTKRGSKK